MTQSPQDPSIMDDSGQFDVRKFRKSGGVLLPIGVLFAVIGGAIAWGTNANRLANVEQQQADGKTELQQIEIHLSSDDSQIAVLTARLQVIIEQLAIVNQKLDRAEEERRK